LLSSFEIPTSFHFLWFVAYLKKYQEDCTNVSSVSVSLVAAVPHFGQVQFFQVGCLSSGFPSPVISTSSGSATGRFSIFSVTNPQDGQ